MSNPYIIITAPHSKCYSETKLCSINDPNCVPKGIRTCDMVAKDASQYLFDIVKKEYPNTMLYQSNVFRDEKICNNTECDLNRPWAVDKTEYWKTLLTKINEIKGKYYPIFLIDIHSFPSEILPDMYHGEHIHVFLIDNSGYYHNQIYSSIFTNTTLQPDNQSIQPYNGPCQYVVNLYNQLRYDNIDTTIFQGTYENAIIIEGLSQGFKSILIEFNEDNPNYIIQNICQSISKWISSEISMI